MGATNATSAAGVVSSLKSGGASVSCNVGARSREVPQERYKSPLREGAYAGPELEGALGFNPLISLGHSAITHEDREIITVKVLAVQGASRIGRGRLCLLSGPNCAGECGRTAKSQKD